MILFLVLDSASARPKPPHPVAVSAGASWSAQQATGAPDVPVAGDHVNAWAAQAADSGPEWLEVTFPKSVDIAEVRIRENDAPGAVSRVLTPDDDVVLWEGRDPTTKALTDFVVRPKTRVITNRIRIEFDTSRVSGWNEIDAVELVGKDGSRQWASGAEASSSYGSYAAPAEPLHAALNRPVNIRLRGGGEVQGMLTALGYTYLTLEQSGKTTLVRRDAADAVTW